MSFTQLFPLTEDGRYVLSYDKLQWAIERVSAPKVNSTRKKASRTPVCFIAGFRDSLHKSMSKRQITPSDEAVKLVNALPDRFSAFLVAIQGKSADEYVETLRDTVRRSESVIAPMQEAAE